MAAAGPVGPAVNTDAMKKRLDEVRIKTGENLSFGGGEVVEGEGFASYVHHDGKKGAMIVYSGELDADTGVGICQHIVAASPAPIAVDEHGVPADVVATKTAEAVAEAKASGKPEQIAQKMAEGKLRKFFEEVTLLGQKYVRDDKKAIKEILPAGVKISKFFKMGVGQNG
jgi:elongation factor Ts